MPVGQAPTYATIIASTPRNRDAYGAKNSLRKLFGTDGIRGVAGEYPLDRQTVYAVGCALGHHLPAGIKRVLIGQDTRESSVWIADVLQSGLQDSGVETASAGVITTPGVAYLTHTRNFSAG